MPPRIQSKVDYQLPVYYPELSKSKKSQGDKRTFQQKAWDFKHGTISADKRNFIQRAADDLYNQGILGASLAAIADILPGIPFVDIIDPPEQLSDEGMQTARNVLGLGTIAAGLSKVPQAAGRVATNLRTPYSYGGSIPQISSDLERSLYSKEIMWRLSGSKNVKKAKRAVQSIIKDEPIYGKWSSNVKYEDTVSDAREFLYRKMFGLKPRAGKNIFKENKDGTFSFNPESKKAKRLIDELITHFKHDTHSVMGGYSRKREILPSGKIKVSYEDIWDFKMNPSDWELTLGRLKEGIANKDLYQLVGESSRAGIRTLVDLITNPVHIKGSAVFGSGRRNDRILHQIDRLKARKMLEELKKVFAKGKVKN